MLSSLHTANLSWETRSFTPQTRLKSQRMVICNMADLVHWESRRTVKQKRREEPESVGENNVKVWMKPSLSVSSSIFVYF